MDVRRLVLLPLELELLWPEELECFMVVGEVGSTERSSMCPAGIVVMATNPPRPGTRGDVGDRSPMRSLWFYNQSEPVR